MTKELTVLTYRKLQQQNTEGGTKMEIHIKVHARVVLKVLALAAAIYKIYF